MQKNKWRTAPYPCRSQAAACWSDVTKSAAGVFIVSTEYSVYEILHPTIRDKYYLILSVGGRWCYGVIKDQATPSTDVTGVISLPVCQAKYVMKAATRAEETDIQISS